VIFVGFQRPAQPLHFQPAHDIRHLSLIQNRLAAPDFRV
jgi:hypothetical protein